MNYKIKKEHSASCVWFVRANVLLATSWEMTTCLPKRLWATVVLSKCVFNCNIICARYCIICLSTLRWWYKRHFLFNHVLGLNFGESRPPSCCNRIGRRTVHGKSVKRNSTFISPNKVTHGCNKIVPLELPPPFFSCYVSSYKLLSAFEDNGYLGVYSLFE